MAELKTQPTSLSVDAFLNSLPDEQQRADCFAILEMMRKATGCEPRLWSDKIVGFCDYHYRYASGREGDWFRTGFAPRKQNITLYLSYDIQRYASLLETLGKYKTGQGCLYIKKLSDVDSEVLQSLIQATLAERT